MGIKEASKSKVQSQRKIGCQGREGTSTSMHKKEYEKKANEIGALGIKSTGTDNIE